MWSVISLYMNMHAHHAGLLLMHSEVSEQQKCAVILIEATISCSASHPYHN